MSLITAKIARKLSVPHEWSTDEQSIKYTLIEIDKKIRNVTETNKNRLNITNFFYDLTWANFQKLKNHLITRGFRVEFDYSNNEYALIW